MNRLRRAAACIAIFLIAGCAAPERVTSQFGTKDTLWAGRLSLQVADQPSQSFAALFELTGGPEAGELLLSTPVGSTIAQLRWLPGSATLTNGSTTRVFASVDELVRQATGTAVPVPALFDWLAGTPTGVPGWRPDLSQLAAGRLQATRSDPTPSVDLRIAIDR